MSAIGPGDWVECVESSGRDALAVGSVYQVVAICPSSPGDTCDLHGPGCELAGIAITPDPIGEADDGSCYCAGGFRPIYRPKSSLIEDLKQPVRESVDA